MVLDNLIVAHCGAVGRLSTPTGLDHRFREGRRDRLGKALEPAHDGDQDVLEPPVLELVHHREPEFGTFVLGDPQAQNLTLAIAGDAEGDVDGLVLDRSAVGIPNLHP